MKNKKTLLIFLLPAMLLTMTTGCKGKPKSYFVDLYAINDVHGRILENHLNAYSYEPGLAKTASFIKELKASSDNFIFLNSGDMFQDTYDSYSNYGNLMAEVLPLMETDAMAIGNHEFDWGADKLIKNRQLSGNTTYLSSNIYHYDQMRKEATDFASEIGEKYKIIERDGLKIGVIGIIGREQITSIFSKMVDDYIFLEPTPIVKDIAEDLKANKGCDAVVVCAHADYKQLQEQSRGQFAKQITDISPVTNKRYVDAVFTAHTHKNQIDYYNDVPFIQSGCHGEELGYIRLDVSTENPTCEFCEHVSIPDDLKEDETVKKVVDKYLDQDYFNERNEVIGTTDMNSLSRDNAGRMLAWMTYETLKEDANAPKNIDVVLNNGGRSSPKFKNHEVRRVDIFDAIPFTNQTKVVKIKGYDLIKNIGDYDYPYYAPNPINIYANETYTVATIDYILYHKDAERNFNYFRSFDEDKILYSMNDYAFDIVSNYIKNHHNSDGGYDLLYNDLAAKPGYTNVTI